MNSEQKGYKEGCKTRFVIIIPAKRKPASIKELSLILFIHNSMYNVL